MNDLLPDDFAGPDPVVSPSERLIRDEQERVEELVRQNKVRPEKDRIDCEAMIRDMGWNPTGFRATRARLLAKFDLAMTVEDYRSAAREWESFEEDLSDQHLFSIRTTIGSRPETLRALLLEPLSPTIAEALDDLRNEVSRG